QRPWRAAMPRPRRPGQPAGRPGQPAGRATPRFHAEAAQATPQRVRRTQVTIIPTPTEGSSTPPGSGVSPASPRKPGGHTPPLNGHLHLEHLGLSVSLLVLVCAIVASLPSA